MSRPPIVSPGPPAEQRPSALYRFGWPLAIVAIATLIRLPLDEPLHPSGFLITLTAVMVAAWVGGFGPTLVIQTVVLVVEYQVFNPEKTFELSVRDVIELASFYLVGTIIALLSDKMHAARRRERAQRNEALWQREQLLATLACMGDGVLVAGADARVTLMNPAAEAMIGRPAAECQGQLLGEVLAIDEPGGRLPPKHLAERVERESAVVSSDAPVQLVLPDGGRLPVSYTAAPIHDADGRRTGVVVVFRDESQRERTEQDLREADRRKDEFLATLAHELRNPLAPISTGLEVMKMTAGDATAAEEVRSMMERQTQHMVRLIDDLLDVSRITRGRLELRKRDCTLADVVRNAIDAARPQVDDAGHELNVRLPAEPMRLHADANRLTQVLSNLISNAARFTPAGGRIDVVAQRQGDDAVVTVADNGVGIPAYELKSIFEMFTQVNRSPSGQAGLGIGLTLARQLVEMHGGTIDVESAGANRGSTFRVRIPIGAPTPVPAGAPAVSAAPEGRTKRRVLVVDDNEDALKSLAMMVKIMGNDAREACDGVEAVEAAAAYRPDVVLMDLGMPRLDGFGAAELIRREPWGRELLLIATTGWGQDEDRRRTKEAGFDYHLVKPVEASTLRKLLES